MGTRTKPPSGTGRSKEKERETTARIAGRTVSKRCAAVIRRVAKARNMSVSRLVTQILEEHAKRLRRGKSPRRREHEDE